MQIFYKFINTHDIELRNISRERFYQSHLCLKIS